MDKSQVPEMIVVWNWCVKGLGGVVNMLERFEPFYHRVNKDGFKELHGLVQRMNVVVQKINEAHGD